MAHMRIPLEAWPTQAALTESSAAGLTAAALTGLEEEVACQNDAKKRRRKTSPVLFQQVMEVS